MQKWLVVDLRLQLFKFISRWLRRHFLFWHKLGFHKSLKSLKVCWVYEKLNPALEDFRNGWMKVLEITFQTHRYGSAPRSIPGSALSIPFHPDGDCSWSCCRTGFEMSFTNRDLESHWKVGCPGECGNSGCCRRISGPWPFNLLFLSFYAWKTWLDRCSVIAGAGSLGSAEAAPCTQAFSLLKKSLHPWQPSAVLPQTRRSANTRGGLSWNFSSLPYIQASPPWCKLQKK